MSKKEAVKPEAVKTEVDATVEKTEEKQFQYGIAASLMINIVREKRVYRFEMPVGSKLGECEEACNVCVDIVKKMKEDGETKAAEEKAKQEKEGKSEGGPEALEKKVK